MTSYGTTIILDFGKYKGQSVSDVARKDYKYLSWLVVNKEDLDPKVLTEIWVHLTILYGAKMVNLLARHRATTFSSKRKKEKRPWEDEKKEEPPKFNSSATGLTEQFSPGIQKAALDALAIKWFRDSAKKWHPDLCGGNSEPMKAVNDCYDRLKELISKL